MLDDAVITDLHLLINVYHFPYFFFLQLLEHWLFSLPNSSLLNSKYVLSFVFGFLAVVITEVTANRSLFQSGHQSLILSFTLVHSLHSTSECKASCCHLANAFVMFIRNRLACLALSV